MRDLKSQSDDRETSQYAIRNLPSATAENEVTNRFDVKRKNQPIETNASETNIEAEAYYFSATAGARAKNLPIQILENAPKGKNKSGSFQALETVFLKSH